MTKPQFLVAIQIILFSLLFLSLLIYVPQSGTGLRIAGLLIAVMGGLLGLLAIRHHTQGINVVPLPKTSAPLVTTGLYARVRHPIYTGVMLGGFGLAIAHGGIVPLVVALAFVPFFTYKSMYEESLLRRVYPAYEQYMTYTGRFLPKRNN